MTVESELLRIEPEAQQIMLGDHKVYRSQRVTPAHTFASIVKATSASELIQLVARDSYADSLAQHLLDEAGKAELEDRSSERLRVSASAFPDPWKFDAVVVVPPLIAKRFEHRSNLLSLATFWVVPAFAQEFKDGESGKAFWHQLGRKDGWRVHVVDWNRQMKTAPVWD
jgi:hypothetical protein